MFSPFRAEDGSPKPLAQVAWDDLAQLKELDEGFALEFKRENNASVRRKIPKIVASFANSRGGWLVIGIADDTKDVVPVPRPQTDFSQTLGEMCRRHVSPVPPFDVRFIADPADNARGVIVVQVGEGDFPPYIADGLVEIREGSTSGPATGSELVELYDRANKRHAQVEDFCRRTLYYPQTENVPCPCSTCICSIWAGARSTHLRGKTCRAMWLPCVRASTARVWNAMCSMRMTPLSCALRRRFRPVKRIRQSSSSAMDP